MRLNLLKEQYNWQEIQTYYNQDHTWDDIQKKFGLSIDNILRAKQNGLFISRNHRDANLLAHKLNPDSFKHSEETKQKISVSRKIYLKEHPDKVPYLLNHYSKGDSFAEKFFEKYLVGYVKKHRFETYQLDFANLERKIDLEVDGDQHFTDKRIVEHDKKRNAFLIELGWTVIRIRWSYFQEKTTEEKAILIQKLNNFDLNINDKAILIVISAPNEEKMKEFFAKKERRRKESFCSCGYPKSTISAQCNQCYRKQLPKIREKWYDFQKTTTLSDKEAAQLFNVNRTTVSKWKRFYKLNQSHINI